MLPTAFRVFALPVVEQHPPGAQRGVGESHGPQRGGFPRGSGQGGGRHENRQVQGLSSVLAASVLIVAASEFVY